MSEAPGFSLGDNDSGDPGCVAAQDSCFNRNQADTWFFGSAVRAATQH
ncbi:hypothetical protein JXQ70_04300 [bacterium]|nr:hypothetical protein [bacterium]